MSEPWPDPTIRDATLAVEADGPGPSLGLLGEEDTDLDLTPEGEAGVLLSGITSHVVARSGIRITSKSTFKPPHTTEAVWTRVAFFTADTQRRVLSDWKNKGSANPYQTLIQHWYFDDSLSRRALVLWWMNGSTWRSWAG